jgi:nucleoside-diphosphate-sugar epimerase
LTLNTAAATVESVTNLRVLFIGGTGTISAAASELAVQRGLQLTILNRGHTSLRPAPAGVKVLTADMRDGASVRKALGRRPIVVLADIIDFTQENVQLDF